MRPCEYPRDVIEAAIRLVEMHVPPAKDDAPIAGDPKAIAQANFDAGQRALLKKLKGTLATSDREAAEKKP